MLLPFSPTSNAERQRKFRERNPGYFNKYNARRRKGDEASRLYLSQVMQEAEAAVAAADAAAQVNNDAALATVLPLNQAGDQSKAA